MSTMHLDYGRGNASTKIKRLGAGPRLRDLTITEHSSTKEINAVVGQRIKIAMNDKGIDSKNQ